VEKHERTIALGGGNVFKCHAFKWIPKKINQCLDERNLRMRSMDIDQGSFCCPIFKQLPLVLVALSGKWRFADRLKLFAIKDLLD
jgi:hypothetical protein